MTTLAPDPVAPEQEQPISQELFALLDAMDNPRGARAEILDGETITVSPTPSGMHQENVHRLDEQLRGHLPDGHRSEGYLEVRIPDLLRSVIPDLFVAPREELITDDHFVAPENVLLVAEVVSPGSRARDRKEKLHIYALAMIQVYVLVDPVAAEASVYSDPRHGRYRERKTGEFGKALPVPEPFGFSLDTGKFLPYG